MKNATSDLPAEHYTPDYYRLHRRRYLLRDAWVEKRIEDVLGALRPGIGEKILDAGCGIGMIALECRKRGAEVTATDYSPEALLAARDLELAVFGDNRIRYLLLASERVSELPGPFDKIVAADFAEHVSREKFSAFAAGAAARLRPGGLLVVYTPNGPVGGGGWRNLLRRVGLLPGFRRDDLAAFARRRRSPVWHPCWEEPRPPDQSYEYLHVDVKPAEAVLETLRRSGLRAEGVSVSRSSSRLQALPHPLNLLWGGHLCVCARKAAPGGG